MLSFLNPSPVRWRVVGWLFPRLLALVYAIAFASWAVQCAGLVGEGGLLPTADLMQVVREREVSFLDFPTVFHWHYSDAFQTALCWIGVGLSGLVIAGVWQGPLLALLWLGYLSLCATGGLFLGYQWDALLLEAGLLGLFLAPWRWWSPRADADAPTGAVFLLHWLLFRLMWLSGYVKIGGEDAVWLDNTALLYHFQTQPLPNGLSWWAHQLPQWLHVLNCRVMYGIELWLPFAMFLGRWGRLAACLGFSALMGGIALTGNYTFFNLLTFFLSLTLLDDSWWPAVVKHRLHVVDTPRPWWKAWHSPAYVCVVALTFFSLVAADNFLQGRVKGYHAKAPAWASSFLAEHLSPWRSLNAYGLFQDMTEERLEVVIEVSDDGAYWQELPFRWKPGDVKQAPGWVAPHQPRLDWQMWFAALYPGYVPQRDADPRSPLHWFGRFMTGLVENKPAIWALVGEPPFPADKVTHARARLYRYRFTTPEERQASGARWKRERLGDFCPVFSRTGQP